MSHPPDGGPGKRGFPLGLSGETIEVAALARQYGVPRSILLGRAWPGPGEPLWLPSDLEGALAYERWQAERCPRCGTFPAEWLDDKGKFLEDEPYEVIAHECPGCDLLKRHEHHENTRSKPGKGGFVPSVSWRLRRRHGPPTPPGLPLELGPRPLPPE